MTLDRRNFLKLAGAQTGLLVTGACALPSALARRRAADDAPVFGSSADVAVIGAGAFGGWTAYHLRRMGARVILVDAFGPGNSRATSGDETRGVRTSYGDRPHGEQWVRWASDAIGRWRRWDEEWGREMKLPLFFTTGDLILRKEWEPYLKDTKALWEKVGIRHEVLPLDEVRYRYPVIGLKDIAVVLYEPDAGVVRSRRACEAVAEVYRQLGGKVVVARAWLAERRDGRLHDIVLSTYDTVRADSFVFACGPWLWKIFPEILRNRLRTPLGYVFYFGTPEDDHRFTYPQLPSYNFTGITGWPALGQDNRGFRVRTGGGGLHSDPDTSTRWIAPTHLDRPRQFLADRFPVLHDAPLLETRACHYELTVTRNFMIDRHPDLSNVWIAGGGSAEGFKFGPVVGEYIARRVLGRAVDPELAKGFALSKEEFEDPMSARRPEPKAEQRPTQQPGQPAPQPTQKPAAKPVEARPSRP